MRHTIFYVFALSISFFVFSCNADLPTSTDINQNNLSAQFAKKPAANLIGTMDLTFNFDNPVWIGTVKFEDYDTLGMRFYHLSPFKGYSQASPFEEYFEIYDRDDGTVYLAGPDVGVTTLANKPPEPCKYRMNGEIEVANAPFTMWMGRHVHMSGEISWQFVPGNDAPVPFKAPGVFRIN